MQINTQEIIIYGGLGIFFVVYSLIDNYKEKRQWELKRESRKQKKTI